MEDLHVIHRRDRNSLTIQSTDWIVWKTCLRQTAIGFDHFPTSDFYLADPGDQVLRGFEAYSFLLEVICGLHSPLIGETEVLGQFRKHFEGVLYPSTPFGSRLRKLIQNLLEDSKRIREKYLKGIGSQSYGSLVRKNLGDHKTVAVLGAGQLAKSLLPWLASSECTRVTVFCRDTQKSRQALLEGFDDFKVFSGIEIASWMDQTVSTVFYNAVIVAAPISSEIFDAWLGGRCRPDLIIDWRETSSFDRIDNATQVIVLDQCFDEINQTKESLKQTVIQASAFARVLALKRAETVQVRPYGWEDLCV